MNNMLRFAFAAAKAELAEKPIGASVAIGLDSVGNPTKSMPCSPSVEQSIRSAAPSTAMIFVAARQADGIHLYGLNVRAERPISMWTGASHADVDS